MKMYRLGISILLIWLSFNSIKGQSFFEFKNFNVTAGYGKGKIVYYFNYHPGITIAMDSDALEYSPAWYLGLEGKWRINQYLDFVMGLDHTTITERNEDVPLPDWAGIGEVHLVQGFLHITPGFSLSFNNDIFCINASSRIGTASFIGNSRARNTSNAIGNADFGFELGTSVRMYKRLSLNIFWIQGTTKYGVFNNDKSSFFKYHSYMVGVNYVFHEKK